jgi:hypothetical protein
MAKCVHVHERRDTDISNDTSQTQDNAVYLASKAPAVTHQTKTNSIVPLPTSHLKLAARSVATSQEQKGTRFYGKKLEADGTWHMSRKQFGTWNEKIWPVFTMKGIYERRGDEIEENKA